MTTRPSLLACEGAAHAGTMTIVGAFGPRAIQRFVMKPSLRVPATADYAAIASWIPDAESALRWAGPRVSFPFTASGLPALLAVPGGGESSYCLVDGAADPCGFGQHWVAQPGTVHLGRLIVAPNARGRGLGRALCEQLVCAACASSAAAAVTLRVYRDNPIAVRLYASLGFAEVAAESTEDVAFMRTRV